MDPVHLSRLVLSAMVVASAIGAVDAAAGETWDLLVVFGVVGGLALVQLARTAGRRPTVRLRADLHRWLSRRAEVSGETVEHLADRAVAGYRAGLVDDDDGG